jgi:hypothetical protein
MGANQSFILVFDDPFDFATDEELTVTMSYRVTRA